MPPFGDKLKKQREKSGITLDDVALSTKIGTRFLRALEEDHFDQLPGGIFNRGFIRAYARCVGLDEEQAIADYLAASGEKKVEAIEPAQAPVPQPPVPKAVIPKKEAIKEKEKEEDSRNASNFSWVRIAGVLAVIVLGLAIWRFFSKDSSAGSTQVGSVGTSTSSTPAQTSPLASQNTGTQSAPSMPTGTTGASNTPPAPASFVVLIKASEDSWVSIAADGKPIFEDTMEAPAEKSVEAHSEVVVKVGNMGGLDFWFNGTKLTSQGEEGEVKTLTFDTNGLRPQVPKPQPADAPTPSP